MKCLFMLCRRNINRKKLFTGTVPAYNLLYTGTVPVYNSLYTGTPEIGYLRAICYSPVPSEIEYLRAIFYSPVPL